jgi:hypothetical protein
MVSNEELVDYRNALQKQFNTMHTTLNAFETVAMQKINTLIANVDPTPIVVNIVDVAEDLKPLMDSDRLVISNDTNYVVTDIFTTYNGNWEATGQPFAIKQRFRDKFLKPTNDPLYIDDGGAQKHILVGVYDKDGKPIQGKEVLFNTRDEANRYVMPTKKSGFSNVQLSASSAFWPDSGQAGFWYITLPGTNLKVTGLGLPNKWHIATYIIIKKIN